MNKIKCIECGKSHIKAKFKPFRYGYHLLKCCDCNLKEIFKTLKEDKRKEKI